MLVLFDIDGTLTTGSRCGRAALEHALHEVLGIPDALAGVVLHGNIDWLIVEQAARAAGVWPHGPAARRSLVVQVLSRYREHFDIRVETEPYAALPAAARCVTAAAEACEIVGLATGNIEACAHGKLRSAGLGPLFRGCIGGYGDEAETRADVVRLAIRRGRDRGVRAAEVLVIGDTPADVSAGQAAGARVAAVATGRYGVAELRSAGAEHVYTDLRALLASPPWA